MPDGLQRIVGTLLAVLTLPLVGLLAVLVRLETPGPALFRAARVGGRGLVFTCYKLRTMRTSAAASVQVITISNDPRVTRVGRILRGIRLDELPQLWNVARGEMRLVGPRPEDPRFIELGNPLHRAVFAARPGITGLTQLVYLRESEQIPDGSPEDYYREQILPAKLAIDARYLANRSTVLDLWILWATAKALVGRPPSIAEVDHMAPRHS